MKKHSQIILLAIFLCAAFLNLKCKNEPTQPKDNTPDTTSHNFSWTITQLGDGASSMLYDVAIINDTLAYAVGAIYLKDSLGNWDSLPYNLAIWNGREWKLEKISVEYKGNQTVAPLTGIFVLSDGTIILSSGLPYLPNGNGWTLYHLWDMGVLSQNDGSVNHIWGTSLNDLYFCGNNGTIVHYNGSSWTKIESGTSLDIQDIYGAYNSVTSQWEILAVAGNAGSSYDRKILQIKGTSASTLSDNPISLSLSSVWFVPNQRYYVVGDGIYEKNNLSDASWIVHQLDLTQYYTTQVRGNSINDVFIVGAGGEVKHYNGKSWLSYQSITGLSNGAYGSVALKNNLVIAVGMDSPRAVVTIGRR